MAANPGSAQWIELERAGMAALDEFMETFNSGSPLRWAQSACTIRTCAWAASRSRIWNSPEDYAQDNDVAACARPPAGATKWDRRGPSGR